MIFSFSFAHISKAANIKAYGDLDHQLNMDLRYLFYNKDTALRVVKGTPIDKSILDPLRNSNTLENMEPQDSNVDDELKYMLLMESNPNVPVRLTFLTPAGKRVVELPLQKFLELDGDMMPIRITIMQIIARMTLSKFARMFRPEEFVFPLELIFSLEAAKRLNGFDREKLPIKPLNTPPIFAEMIAKGSEEVNADQRIHSVSSTEVPLPNFF